MPLLSGHLLLRITLLATLFKFQCTLVRLGEYDDDVLLSPL